MERRQDNRINALIDAEEQVTIQNEGQPVSSTLINLSAGGALLTLKNSSVQFTAGDTSHLLFDNGGELLQLDATAIRTDGTKIAFRFQGLSVEQKRAIHTKMIRMAIISARVRDGKTNARNGRSGGVDFSQSDNGILLDKQLCLGGRVQ
jgi:c-di-GMP-binding flagellar brake protein YcgR